LPTDSSPKIGTRSRVVNGKKLLPRTDGRGHWARVMSDTLQRLIAHCGGQDVVAEPVRLLARRIACLESELCYLEGHFAKCRAEGRDPGYSSLDPYNRLSGGQRRLLESLGLQRRPRDITPDPLDYARQHAEAKRQALDLEATDVEE